METIDGLPLEEKKFLETLREEPEPVQSRYYQVLAKRRNACAQELQGKPPVFTLDEKKELLKEARLDVEAGKMGIADREEWHKKTEAKGQIYRGDDD
jgi:hypothetical protein